MLNTVGKNLSSLQLQQLNRFGRLVSELGVNFAVYDADNELVLQSDGGKFTTSPDQLTKSSRQALEQTLDISNADAGSDILQLGEGNQVLATVLKSPDEVVAVALIDLGNIPAAEAEQPRQYCSRKGLDCKHVDGLSELSVQANINYLKSMLSLLAEDFQAQARAEAQIEMVSTELAQTYEELVLLHKLSTNMKVTEPDVNFLQMACDNLTEIISVEGIAVLLEKAIEDEKRLVLAAGIGLIDIDEQMAAVLKGRLVDEINAGQEALLDSEVDSPLKYQWPEHIKSIIAVPLWGKSKPQNHFSDIPPSQNKQKEAGQVAPNGNCVRGLMVAINRIDKPDFDSTDVKLFNSVANGCAVFVENGRLFKDLKELFIGALRALTSSIDAKDQYTRGHSERVAFISRWIAERLAEEESLKEEEIHKIYLAGLLHDIGKMGIDESILRKKDKLTEQEFDHIRAHSSIGASILSEIKQMRDIVPGVLSHHERVDGDGYPNGLVGDQIPLIGKIIGLADSFDAMTSKRVYRNAMTVTETLTEIEKNLGTQFDEKVGRAFIDSNVYELWDIMQGGFAEIYGKGDFAEYGTAAVGSIIR
ncbi:MAG: HD-GYP domain-containing protein [Planctomycetota bacterium]|nr:MAG: HD-GYP domain-containing protein [Planctomycetota bacterium]